MGGLWTLQSRLLVAIQNNDAGSAHRLLEQGVDADIRFCIGAQRRPAVCLCVERGSLPLVSLLVEWGCSVNQRDSGGLSPLHLAASFRHASLVKLLLSHRADVHAKSDLGATPLHLAAQRGCADIVHLLVSSGAELDRPDNKGQPPLVLACIQGHAEVVNCLLRHGAYVNHRDNFGNTPLLQATSAAQLSVDVISALVTGGAVVRQNMNGESPLHAVVRGRRTNKSAALKALIATGCSLDVRTTLGHTPMHLAILEKESDLVRMLVSAGCEVNSRDELGHSPLYHVVNDGNRRLVELFLAAGVNLESNLSWLDDKNDVTRWMLESHRKLYRPPSLLTACRRTVHDYLRHDADDVIQDMMLPINLKMYLTYHSL